MNRQDFQQTIEECVHRVPFQPFVIDLSNGERIVVRDPTAFTCQAGAAAYVPPDGDLSVFDYHAVREIEVIAQ